MKRNSWVATLMAATLLVGATVNAQDEDEPRAGIDFDLVVNAIPAAILIDMRGNKFKTSDDDGNTTGSMSQVFAMPNLLVGVGADVGDSWYLDATIGPGIIVNDTFRSTFIQGILAANYLVSDTFVVGPRAGFVHHLNPSWTEDDSIDFDTTTGYLAGIYGAMGDKVKYWLSVDVMSSEFDVEVKQGSTTSDTYDLTGLAIQFGVRGEF